MLLKIDAVIEAYMKLRGEKDKIVRESKVALAHLESKMMKLEGYLLTRMAEDGVTSYKSEFGTAFRTEVDFASVGDWTTLLDYIRENEAWDLLEKRVSKQAVKGYIQEKQPIPPGVNYGTKIDIGIRKPSGE